MAEHALEFPIIIDNDFAVWQAYGNRYWPAQYLIDREGLLRYAHLGEGAYEQTEQAIQLLLREAFPQVVLPGVMEPVVETDAPAAVSYRVTPELYLGYERGRIGNTAAILPDKPSAYSAVDKRAEGYAYLEGDWQLMAEGVARPVAAAGESKLHLKYMAKELNLVAVPPLAGGAARIELLQDGAPLAAEDAGADVTIEDGKAFVTVDAPRMYRLVNNRAIDAYELSLSTTADGVSLYAFTFVSCLLGT